MRIPSIELTAKFTHQGDVYMFPLSHLITLRGAREPNNMMIIEIDPSWLMKGILSDKLAVCDFVFCVAKTVNCCSVSNDASYVVLVK